MTTITTTQVLTLLRDALTSSITASADMTPDEISRQRADIALLAKIELTLVERERLTMQIALDQRSEALISELRLAVERFAPGTRFEFPIAAVPSPGVMAEMHNLVDPIFCRKPVAGAYPGAERPCNRPEAHDGECDPEFFAPKQTAAQQAS